MALLEEDLVFFVVNFEYLLKASIKLVGVGRGPAAGEGRVSVHHGRGGKGVATKLNSLAKRVTPELVFTCVQSESRGAHGELKRERERERVRERVCVCEGEGGREQSNNPHVYKYNLRHSYRTTQHWHTIH